jgi:hypothetical protein
MISKGNAHPIKGHESPDGVVPTYSSTLSLASSLDGIGGQRHVPATLPTVNDPEPITQEAGWAPRPA